MKFDIFTIKHYKEGWYLQVGLIRPNNAPRMKYTKADRDRQKVVLDKNIELSDLFPTFSDLCREIKKLS